MAQASPSRPRLFFPDSEPRPGFSARVRVVRPPEVSRTWRSARLAAVRHYGEGPVADRAAVEAVKRFFKWLAKHPRSRAARETPVAPSLQTRVR
jgi:hypothetical protein